MSVVPDRYGSWWQVYALFKSWQCASSWDLSIDSTTSRAHVHAAGERRDSSERVGGEPADHALGRSCGGFSTKIHLARDGYLQAVSFTITAGQDGNAPQLTEVLKRVKVNRSGRSRPRTRPNRAMADKGLFRF